jgi:hypothetical protein
MAVPGAIVSRIEVLEKCQDEHDDFINGNGQQGAKARLVLIEHNIVMIKDTLKSIQALSYSILSGLVLWFVIQVILKIF